MFRFAEAVLFRIKEADVRRMEQSAKQRDYRLKKKPWIPDIVGTGKSRMTEKTGR